MSLFDVLDQLQGGGSTKLTSPTLKSSGGFLEPYTGEPIQGGSDAARNSRERGVPERIDINAFVPQGFGNPQEEDGSLPMQALEVAGRAPGFVAERPLALFDKILDDGQGNSPLSAIGDFGPIKLFGEVVHNVSTLPGALGNSSTAESLMRGTIEGWSDDTVIQSDLQKGQAQFHPAGMGKTMTWGEFKADAAKKGWTAQDIQDLIDGRKSTTDFGDKAMSSDPLAEVGLRLASDPLNLVFGIGAAAKLASGTGLLARATKAGALLDKPLAPSLAAIASAQGISRGSTWMGLAQYFGGLGRAAGHVPGGLQALETAGRVGGLAATGLKAYKKVAIGTSAAQVGIGALDRATEGFRGGFLEPLFQLNRDVWDNQPLSQNSAFALFSAFHFDVFRGTAKAIGAAKQAKVALVGSSIREDVLKALSEGEGWGGKASRQAVLDRLGGPAELDNLIVHTHANIVFSRLMKNPVIRATLSHYDSIDEAILSNAKLGQQIERILIDEYKGSRFSGKQTVEQLKAWHANRSGVEQKGIEFQWDGAHAADRWVEYAAAVAPVSRIFHERGDIVMGLVDHVMAEDLRNMGSALRVAGGAEKRVPIAEVRKWLSRYPQLTQDEWWGKFNLKEYDGQTVPYGPLQGKLTKLAKEAPTVRDVTRELSAAERAAGKQEFLDADPAADLAQPAGSTVSVSRMRPQIAKRLGMKSDSVDSIQAARADAEVAAFEGNIGQALEEAGLPADVVEQAIGAWDGSLEPSVQIKMSTATLPELRLAAALLGRAGKQDAVALAVTGPRVRELGLGANGFEVKIALPAASREQLQALHEALAREFPGYTINDTTGVVSILVPEGDRATLTAALDRISPKIEGIYPKDLIGETGIATSVHPAYIEFITKGEGPGSYASVIREARAYGDPRADATFAPAVARPRPAGGNAQAGVGPDQAVGRQPGDGGVNGNGDPSQPPAARGLGEVASAPHEAGYVYHATTEDALLGIAQDGLRPFGAEHRQAPRPSTSSSTRQRFVDAIAAVQRGETPIDPDTGQPLTALSQEHALKSLRQRMNNLPSEPSSPTGSMNWPDGGSGKRTWFTDTPTDAAQYGVALVRVRQGDAGRVRRSLVSQEPYSAKTVKPALVEVWGADGQWHPLDEWFAPTLERDIVEGAQAVLPEYQKGATTDYSARHQVEGQIFEYGGLGRWWGDQATADAYKGGAGSMRLEARFRPRDVARMVDSPSASGLQVPDDVPALVTGVQVNIDGTWHDLPVPDRQFAPIGAGAALDGLDPAEFTSEPLYRSMEAGVRVSEPLGPFDPVPDTLTAGLRAHEDQPGQVLWAAGRDAEVSSEIPFHRSLSGLDDVARAELAELERQLREHYPTYTLQKSPNSAIIMADRGEIAAQYLRDRTKVGEVLATWGPLGKISRLLDWLRTPVQNAELTRAARQALMNELLPHGAKPKEVDDFLSRLDQEASKHTIGPMGVRVFRNGTSLNQQTINRLAGGDPELGITGSFSEKTVAAIGRDNFARVIDRASNRFIRTMDERAGKGGKKGSLARGITRMYDGFAHTGAGDVSRLVSKTFYHWFRFLSDPRWWAMNLLEADMIGGLKYGIGATRFKGAQRADVEKPALFHQLGGKGDSDAFERALGDGNGWMYTRRQGGYISRAFDHERPETVAQILRDLPQNDPIIADLREIVKAQDAIDGRVARTDGEIIDEDMVEAIDRLLYSMDEKGARATVVDEAKAILGAEETQRLLPFLQKVWESNDKTYHSIVEMFHGNPSRTNLERIANSYWLYWPISYQIKATKWLVNVMAKGAVGKQTNLAGAALYAHYVEEHRKRLASDPNYVALFEDHPTAWFVSQMLFPITPGDIGVSLSRPIRYGVGAAGDAIEDATGSRLGLWGSYKSAEDPITAAGAILSMGPVYTSELLARLGRELFEEPTENLYP